MSMSGNIGIRMFLIGKDGVLAGISEVKAAAASMNREMAAGTVRSSELGLLAMGDASVYAGTKARLYQQELAKVNAETAALARVGKVAFFGMAAAAGIWGYESVKWARSYQTELLKLQTQAGRTAGAMNAIGRAAMANAQGLGISPTTYLQAAYQPASAQMSVRETLAVTQYGAKAAGIAGLTAPSDIENTVGALTSVVLGYKRPASEVGKTAAQLNAIVGQGRIRYAQLNEALNSGIASTAASFGIGLTSLGSSLAYLTDLGVPAAQAGTRLRMGLTLLGAPTAESSKLLNTINLDTTSKQNAQSAAASLLSAAGINTTKIQYALSNNKGGGGIYNALELLHQHLDASGMDPELQRTLVGRAFGGGRMGTAIIQMYQNLPRLYNKNLQVGEQGTQKKFNEDWAKTTETLNFQLHRLSGTIHTLGISFGTDLLPGVTKGVSAMASFLQILERHKGVALALAGVVTAVLVPAIGLYLFRALTSLTAPFRALFGAMGRFVTGQSAEQVAAQRTNALLAEQAGLMRSVAAASAGMTLSQAEAETGQLALGTTLASQGGVPFIRGVNGRLVTQGAGAAALAGQRNALGRYGGLIGGKVGLGGKLLGAAGTIGLGLLAGQMIRGGAGSTLTDHETTVNAARTLFGDAGEGAIVGGTIGSIVPGVGTAVGAGLGAVGGVAYGARHQIGHALTGAWDSLFGGGGSQTSNTSVSGKNRLHIVAHVYIDGKEIKNATVKYVKADAARR